MEDEIASQIHGEPIGATSSRIYCDGIHDSPQPVDPSGRVQYECLRIGESMTNLRAFGVPEGWVSDLLRCPACEIEALNLPTDGYAEALVEVDIDHSGESYVIDAADLTLLEYSPVAEGEDPPKMPLSFFQTMIIERDYGGLRRSRLAPSVPVYREHGADLLADQIEKSL